VPLTVAYSGGSRLGALSGIVWIVGAFAVAASIQFQQLLYLSPAVLGAVITAWLLLDGGRVLKSVA
jgi:hypothetical protein